MFVRYQRILKFFIFKLATFFFGIRFHFVDNLQNAELYDTVTLEQMSGGVPMVFHLYRSRIEIVQIRFGKFRTRMEPRYSIVLRFEDANHPELYAHYNNKAMTFNIPYTWLISERSISRILLDKYVSYVSKTTFENTVKAL